MLQRTAFQIQVFILFTFQAAPLRVQFFNGSAYHLQTPLFAQPHMLNSAPTLERQSLLVADSFVFRVEQMLMRARETVVGRYVNEFSQQIHKEKFNKLLLSTAHE